MFSRISAVLVFVFASVSSSASLYFADGEQFNFGFDVGPSWASANLSMDDGTILYASASANGPRYYWVYDPILDLSTYQKIVGGVWLNFNFSGVKTPPLTTGYQGQGLQIYRNGLDVYGSVHASVYDINPVVKDSVGVEPVVQHLVSSASAYFTGSFIIDGYAQAVYSEYDYTVDFDGITHVETGFSARVQVPIIWNSGGTVEVPMMSVGVAPTVVPEPASVSLLVLSAIGLLTRRRQSL